MTNLVILALLFVGMPIAAPAIHSAEPYSLYCASKEQPVLMLYYTSYCPYSQKVLRYLQQIGKKVPMTNLENNPQGVAELTRIGGKKQVPCLVINGKALYESDDIIAWLSQHQDLLESN